VTSLLGDLSISEMLATALHLHLSFHHIGGGWCHVFCCLCAATRGSVVSGTRGHLSRVHNGMRDELAQKKRGACESATVLLSLSLLIKQRINAAPKTQGKRSLMEQPITVSAKSHRWSSVSHFHFCNVWAKSFITAFRFVTFEMRWHEIQILKR